MRDTLGKYLGDNLTIRQALFYGQVMLKYELKGGKIMIYQDGEEEVVATDETTTDAADEATDETPATE